MKKYKFLEHTADIKFTVMGKSIEEIFENSALAVSEFISKYEKIKSKAKKGFVISAEDHEELLYKFLDELIYLLDAKSFVCSHVKVSIKNGKKEMTLKAIAYGDKTKNYMNLEHIKAATYSEMYLKKVKNGWKAQAVIDI
ncbi:MAG: archease [Candidatus Nanoarchaeia archaeon]